ncbi:MAG: hypothetical protein IPO09_16675, partial [Anaeromyxobacter sp.]|nr:hypothetical protein [Anaeromyxobacter sp.]
ASPVVSEGDELPLSQIAGVLLNAVFLDSPDTDPERLSGSDRTLSYIPRSGWWPG